VLTAEPGMHTTDKTRNTEQIDVSIKLINGQTDKTNIDISLSRGYM